MSNLVFWGPEESVDTHIEGVSTKITKGPSHTHGVLSVLGVPSQLKMSNLKYWGPGESVDTHILGVCEKVQNFEFPTKRHLGALGTFRGRYQKGTCQRL